MKRFSKTAQSPVFVAIDVAKLRHHVLIESAGGKRKALTIANTRTDFDKLALELKALSSHCEVALEPTGDYHRPLVNFLLRCGHNVKLFLRWPRIGRVKRFLIPGTKMILRTLRSFCICSRAA